METQEFQLFAQIHRTPRTWICSHAGLFSGVSGWNGQKGRGRGAAPLDKSSSAPWLLYRCQRPWNVLPPPPPSAASQSPQYRRPRSRSFVSSLPIPSSHPPFPGVLCKKIFWVFLLGCSKASLFPSFLFHIFLKEKFTKVWVLSHPKARRKRE